MKEEYIKNAESLLKEIKQGNYLEGNDNVSKAVLLKLFEIDDRLAKIEEKLFKPLIG